MPLWGMELAREQLLVRLREGEAILASLNAAIEARQKAIANRGAAGFMRKHPETGLPMRHVGPPARKAPDARRMKDREV